MAAEPTGSPWPRHVLRWAFTATLGVACGYALLVAARRIEQILLLVALSLLFTFGLQRPVTRLTRRGMSRRLAAVVVLLAGLVVAAALLSAVVPTAISQVRSLISNLPHYSTEIRERKGTLGRLAADLHLQTLVSSLSKSGSSGSSKISLGGFVGVGETVLSGVGGVVVVAVLTCYLLFTLPRIEAAIYRLVPASRRDRGRQLGQDIVERVGGYVVGQLFVALVAGLGTLVWLLIFQIPFPLALAVLVAILGLIPVVGSTLGGALVTLVSLSKGLPIGAATLAYYVAYRLFEDYLLVPRVMRRTVEVSPLVTIVALLIGGSLLGIIGALLAVPVAATIQLVVSEVALPRLDSS